MGRIGKVIKAFIAKLSGSGLDAQVAAVEEFKGDERKLQIFGPVNEDSAPPNDMKTINIPLGRGRGFLVSVAYHNEKIAPVALPGERRLYSTNEAGDEVQAEVFLKQDGEILLNNALGLIRIEPDGGVVLGNSNGFLSISAAGAFFIGGTDANFATSTLTHGGVNIGKTHSHTQANDSDGDSEADVGVPF
jgi:hypothetical protein